MRAVKSKMRLEVRGKRLEVIGYGKKSIGAFAHDP
jgi:hypothetical protein